LGLIAWHFRMHFGSAPNNFYALNGINFPKVSFPYPCLSSNIFCWVNLSFHSPLLTRELVNFVRSKSFFSWSWRVRVDLSLLRHVRLAFVSPPTYHLKREVQVLWFAQPVYPLDPFGAGALLTPFGTIAVIEATGATVFQLGRTKTCEGAMILFPPLYFVIECQQLLRTVDFCWSINLSQMCSNDFVRWLGLNGIDLWFAIIERLLYSFIFSSFSDVN